jgi:hypothetical protein
MERRQAGSESINEELRHHAVGIDGWQYREHVQLFHEWATRFNQVFCLGLETPAIRIDRIPSRSFGTYRTGRNGLGLGHEVTLNIRHLDRPLADQLRTLLHELLHEWQFLYGRGGRRNYHNRQYRQKASLYGLIVDERGHNIGVEPGPFTTLLAQYGVDLAKTRAPNEEPSLALAIRGDSKLKKWTCGCTNVRCAMELAARCERCGNVFQEGAPTW